MKITTSKKEIVDIIKAYVAISLAFGILLFKSEGAISFFIAAIGVGFGFLLHELAHKVVAQYYRLFAEFRSFDQMLILAILMSFFGFVFAAPGAVMIHGFVNKERNGKISIAGPGVNIILAIIFLTLGVFFGKNVIFTYGYMINVWLALFNMIPFGNFDGSKILKWDKKIYFGFLAVCVFLFITSLRGF